MNLVKTPQARDLLQRHDRTLALKERQILVVADGSRSRAQLLALFGAEAGASIDRLLAIGLLAGHPAPTEPENPRQPTPPETRRSLVAAKMYCLDMLQRLREADAAGATQAIQASASEAALIDNIFAGLRYIHAKTTPSYAMKVADRLEEIIPAAYAGEVAAWKARISTGDDTPSDSSLPADAGLVT